MKKITLLLFLMLTFYIGSKALEPVRVGLNYPTGGNFQVSLVDYTDQNNPQTLYGPITENMNPNSSGVVSFVVGEGDIDWGNKPFSIINSKLLMNIEKDGNLVAQYRLDELINNQAATGDGSVIPTFQSIDGVTVSDSSKFSNDFLFGSSKLNRESNVAETKFYFDQSKQAFRTGLVNTDAWNESNVGLSSFATGRDTRAYGDASAAFGDSTQALSYAEVVIGTRNTSYSAASTSSVNPNDRAFVIGNGTSGSPSDALIVYKNGNMNVKGTLTTSGYTFPNNLGNNLDILRSDGAGGVSWVAFPVPTVVTDSTTITGDGTTGGKIRLKLDNSNTWTADQNVSGQLKATTLATDNYALPTAAATVVGQVLTATNTSGTTAWVAIPEATVTKDSTLNGNGSSSTPLGIDLSSTNTWTGAQTFGDAVVGTNLTMSSLTSSGNQALYVNSTGVVSASNGATARNASGMFTGIATTTATTTQTILNSNVKSGSVIIVTYQGTVAASYRITNITDGTSFTLEFSSALIAGEKIHYMIINN